MMRCRVLQEILELSDEATENAFLDSSALAFFVAGTAPWQPPPVRSCFARFQDLP